jgi:hypothetical protein
MKNKQTKKTPLFTEEEIKILVKLGFESYDEKGDVKNDGDIKEFWKSYSDPKDDEEDWQKCVRVTEKAGVFQINYWSWRYPPSEVRIKGTGNLVDYLGAGKYVDAEFWHRQKLIDQAKPKKATKKTK